MPIAVLASGSGTILEAILAADLPVQLVVADRPCRALEVGRRAGCPATLVDRDAFGGFGPGFDRDAYTEAVTGVLEDAGVDVVVMAGFGTVLGAAVHTPFPGGSSTPIPPCCPPSPGGTPWLTPWLPA